MTHQNKMDERLVVTSDVSSTEDLSDGDWYYQIHSHLEYFPKLGEKIICVVEHASSNKPMIYHWVKPEVIIRSVRQASGKQPAMLICSAYDFYPKLIKINWMRDGEVVTSDVSSIEDLSDGDWYYQIHSHLEYFPKPGEKIICMVEHASSNKPMIYHWDSSLSKFDGNKIITGATGFVLGIILTAGGFIHYKRKQVSSDTPPASFGTTNVMGVDDMVLD